MSRKIEAQAKPPRRQKAKKIRNPRPPEKTKGDGPPIDNAWEAVNRRNMEQGCNDLLKRQLFTGNHWLKSPEAIIEAREYAGMPPLSDREIANLRDKQAKLMAARS